MRLPGNTVVSTASSTTRLPLSVPFVSAHINWPDGGGRDLQAVVDTGCTYFALALVPPASTWIRERAATAVFPDAQTAGGSVHLLAARPRRVSIGRLNVLEPVIGLAGSGPVHGVHDGRHSDVHGMLQAGRSRTGFQANS